MLPNFLTYRAWLSDSQTAAADRLVHSKGRYILVNGRVVAADWDAFISGTLENAINVTETAEIAGGGAWTGTLPNGQGGPVARPARYTRGTDLVCTALESRATPTRGSPPIALDNAPHSVRI